MPRPAPTLRLARAPLSPPPVRRLGRWLAALLCALAVVPGAASATGTGAISGTVTDTVSQAPISGIGVAVFDGSGTQIEATTTAGNGTYTLAGLAGGSYHVQFNGANAGGYVSQWYGGGTDAASSGTVTVSALATTSGINAALQHRATVSGTLTDAGTGVGVGGVEVDVYDGSGTIVSRTCSSADGTYSVGGLAPASYQVGFHPPAGPNAPCPGADYLPDYFHNSATLAGATVITLRSGDTVVGISDALTRGGEIDGAVTSSATQQGLAGITVAAFSSSGDVVQSTCTGANGTYTLMGLPTGAYRVGFLDDFACFGAPSGYANGYYAGPGALSSTLGGAQSLSVTAGNDLPGINGALGARGTTTTATATTAASTTAATTSATTTATTTTSTSSSSVATTSSTASSSPTTSSSATTSTTPALTTTSTTSQGTTTSLIVLTSSSTTTATQSTSSPTTGVQPGGIASSTAPGTGSAPTSGTLGGSGPATGSGPGAGAGAPRPQPPRCVMRAGSAAVLLHAPKRRRHGTRPSVGTLTVTVLCDLPADLVLSAAIYEAGRGSHGTLSVFSAVARAGAVGGHQTSLVLRLSPGARAGLARHAASSALLSLRATGAGGSTTSTAVVGRLRGTG